MSDISVLVGIGAGVAVAVGIVMAASRKRPWSFRSAEQSFAEDVATAAQRARAAQIDPEDIKVDSAVQRNALNTRQLEHLPQDRSSLGGMILEQLNTLIGDFPPLSTNTMRILDELRSRTPNPQRLNEMVKQDPSLTVGLLRVANSAAYAQVNEVTSVEKAVLLVGYDVVLTLALRGAMAGLTANKDRSGLDHEVLLQHNIATGLFAGALARKSGRVDPDEAVTAGLLHDIGKLVMALRYPKQMHEVLNTTTTRLGESRLAKEERTFGFNHAVTGAILAARWQLPTTLVNAIELHHHPAVVELETCSTRDRELTSVVFVANQLAKLAGCPGDDPEVDLPGERLSQVFQLQQGYEALYNALAPSVKNPLLAFVGELESKQ